MMGSEQAAFSSSSYGTLHYSGAPTRQVITTLSQRRSICLFRVMGEVNLRDFQGNILSS